MGGEWRNASKTKWGKVKGNKAQMQSAKKRNKSNNQIANFVQT